MSLSLQNPWTTRQEAPLPKESAPESNSSSDAARTSHVNSLCIITSLQAQGHHEIAKPWESQRHSWSEQSQRYQSGTGTTPLRAGEEKGDKTGRKPFLATQRWITLSAINAWRNQMYHFKAAVSYFTSGCRFLSGRSTSAFQSIACNIYFHLTVWSRQ